LGQDGGADAQDQAAQTRLGFTAYHWVRRRKLLILAPLPAASLESVCPKDGKRAEKPRNYPF
jgi:hypothetical protein